jgi:type IV pilus assembly protein PilM
MSKSVGLDAGEFEVKVVELDGSYRKARLLRLSIERVQAVGADETQAAKEAESALHALQEAHAARENVTMSVPSREAVLRVLAVPFQGVDSIRKMIKFEAENNIHSHNVDDMVVDFHVLAEAGNETKVLIAAVPKPHLRISLQAFERAGIEPEIAELDMMALLRAADWCGALSGPIPDVEAEAPPVEGEPRSRIVIDLGARTLRLLLTREGKLADMRAVRIGVDSIVEEVAAACELPVAIARDAVQSVLQSGEPAVVSVPQPPGDGGETPPPLQVEVTAEHVRAAHEGFLTRLRRELLRFAAGQSQLGRVEVAWITGGGSLLPGVAGTIEEVFTAPCRPLDVLKSLSHNLDDEQQRTIGPRIAVAVGLALKPLGGIGGFNFRQEDLAFTKSFDRIKFPLAIASMLLMFLAVVFALKTLNELRTLKNEYGESFVPKVVQKGTRQKVLFRGHVRGALGWFANERNFTHADYDRLVQTLAATPVFGRLAVLHSTLKTHLTALQRDSGFFQDLKLGSGVGVLTEAARVIRVVEPRLGRFLVASAELHMPPQDEGRFLSIEFVLRGSDYSQKFTALQKEFEEAARVPGSVFAKAEQEGKERPFTEGDEMGAFYKLRLRLRPEKDFPVLGLKGGPKS